MQQEANSWPGRVPSQEASKDGAVAALPAFLCCWGQAPQVLDSGAAGAPKGRLLSQVSTWP